MRPRIPLPSEFASEPFRARDAREFPLGDKRLRGPDLLRPFAGVRATRLGSAEQLYSPLLRPGERFSHASAGRLWGVPLPDRFIDVHVARVGGSRARSAGVIGHRMDAAARVIRAGLPVSDPGSLFLELATLLTLAELVEAGDHLVREPRVLDPLDLRPHISLGDLRQRVREASGRGVRTARSAAESVRDGADSPMETRLRLLAREAGLPEPQLQFELTRPSGRVIGSFDLAWPDARLIAEYDGDQHRTSTRQYELDIRRFDDAADIGWRVIRVRTRGMRESGRQDTARRLRDAFDQRSR